MLERLYLFLDQLGQIGILTRDFFKYLFRGPFESRALVDQLDSVGYRSLHPRVLIDPILRHAVP